MGLDHAAAQSIECQAAIFEAGPRDNDYNKRNWAHGINWVHNHP
jgi:hypothetical protein